MGFGLAALGVAAPVAALATASQLGGAYLQHQGQRDTNAVNREIAHDTNTMSQSNAREAMRFEADQAQAQMAFQERMANSAHQRAVEDLKKAGLNPILAAQNAAAVPSGAAGSGSAGSVTAPTMKNPFEGMAASAMEIPRMLMDLRKQEADIGLMDAQKENLAAQTSESGYRSKESAMRTDTMRKGIPEAELKNDMYDVLRPYMKKLKQSLQSSPKPKSNNYNNQNNQNNAWRLP